MRRRMRYKYNLYGVVAMCEAKQDIITCTCTEQTYLSALSGGLSVAQYLGQAEVGDLDLVPGLHQHIAGSQVSVHDALALQVLHAL